MINEMIEDRTRSWTAAPNWVRTYFVALGGDCRWSRGDTIQEAKNNLLKAANSSTHAYFQRYGLIVLMIRQDEQYPPPYVSEDGCVVSHHNPFNQDAYMTIEEIKRKSRYR